VKLEVEINEEIYVIEVADTLIQDAEEFFTKMNDDMDNGWQMSRWWVPDPDATQRCQIVADKLLDAINNQNESYASLMCAYILKVKPETQQIRINTDGEIQANEFLPS
jgi:hypothetical protein